MTPRQIADPVARIVARLVIPQHATDIIPQLLDPRIDSRDRLSSSKGYAAPNRALTAQTALSLSRGTAAFLGAGFDVTRRDTLVGDGYGALLRRPPRLREAEVCCSHAGSAS